MLLLVLLFVVFVVPDMYPDASRLELSEITLFELQLVFFMLGVGVVDFLRTMGRWMTED